MYINLINLYSFNQDLLEADLVSSDSLPVFIHFYIQLIEHFIDHGCNINEKINIHNFTDIDKKYTVFPYNYFKNIIIISLQYPSMSMFMSLLAAGLIVNEDDQLDIMLFLAEKPDFKFWTEDMQQDYINIYGGTSPKLFFDINIDRQILFAYFFHMSSKDVQKKFLKKHPEFKEIVDSKIIDLEEIKTFDELSNIMKNKNNVS